MIFLLFVDHYPFMIRLVSRYTVKGRQKKSTCGGSLISFSHVLTASHCVYGKPLGNFKESVINPKYQMQLLHKLIKLSQAMQFQFLKCYLFFVFSLLTHTHTLYCFAAYPYTSINNTCHSPNTCRRLYVWIDLVA